MNGKTYPRKSFNFEFYNSEITISIPVYNFNKFIDLNTKII